MHVGWAHRNLCLACIYARCSVGVPVIAVVLLPFWALCLMFFSVPVCIAILHVLERCKLCMLNARVEVCVLHTGVNV